MNHSRVTWKSIREGRVLSAMALLSILILVIGSWGDMDLAGHHKRGLPTELITPADVAEEQGVVSGALVPVEIQLEMSPSRLSAKALAEANDRWDGRFRLPGIEGIVHALAVDGQGNLYAGGWFSTAGGISANHIARWDGATWSTLEEGMNGGVHELVFDGQGNLYAGGEFTEAGGISVNYIARWDGTAWHTLGKGMDGSVSALAVDGQGDLFVGGAFSIAGGISANHIARWDGEVWHTLGEGMRCRCPRPGGGWAGEPVCGWMVHHCWWSQRQLYRSLGWGCLASAGEWDGWKCRRSGGGWAWEPVCGWMVHHCWWSQRQLYRPLGWGGLAPAGEWDGSLGQRPGGGRAGEPVCGGAVQHCWWGQRQ